MGIDTSDDEMQRDNLGYDAKTMKAARDWCAARDEFAEFQSTFRDPNDQTPVNRNDPTRNQIPKPNSPQFPTQAPQTPMPNVDRTPL
jgi:hypothetical protein